MKRKMLDLREDEVYFYNNKGVKLEEMVLQTAINGNRINESQFEAVAFVYIRGSLYQNEVYG